MAEADLQATRVLAVRHGETAWNVDGRIQGHLDLPLNPLGREQARRLGRALADEEVAAVYASDLSRALETARALARHHGLTVAVDVGLRERGFGDFEGLSHAEIRLRWPELAERWRRRDPSFGAPGGETLAGFYERSIEAARRLAAAHPGRTIALVAHGGVMDCLYRAASRVALDAPRSWRLGNAAINRLLHTPQGFTLIGWNDTQHLEGEPPGGPEEGDAATAPSAMARAAS